MFYNRFSMLLHLALMAFPTTFYLRSLMSSTTWRQRPRKPQNLMCNGGDLAWDFYFFVSFWKLFPPPQSRINSEKMCNLEAQSLKSKFFNGARPKFITFLIADLCMKTPMLVINFWVLDFWISTYEKVWKTNKNTYTCT